MAAEADEFHRRPLDWTHKTCLTQIGLLMEGLGSLIPSNHRQQFGNRRAGLSSDFFTVEHVEIFWHCSALPRADDRFS
jgi:hypothetical protein